MLYLNLLQTSNRMSVSVIFVLLNAKAANLSSGVILMSHIAQ